MRVEILMVLGMLSNFGIYPEYFEDYIMRLWVVFKSYEEFFFFFLKQALTWFDSGCKFQTMLSGG